MRKNKLVPGFCEDTALSLAERTFSTEVDEQLAEDVIRYAKRLHDMYTAPTAPAKPEVRKLSIVGAAFDPPSVRRAYTYSDQPNNSTAWKLGRAACKERSGGDLIDYGLQLLHHLQDEGFGVFEIDEADPSPQPAPDVAQLVALLDTLVVAAQRREHSAGSATSVLEAQESLMLAARGAEMALAAYRKQQETDHDN